MVAVRATREAAPGRKRARTSQDISQRDKKERLTNEAFLGTLRALMKDGAFSKAVKHLLSDGLHDPLDPRVASKLDDLHPKRPPAKAEGVPPRPWDWDPSAEGKADRIRSLKN